MGSPDEAYTLMYSSGTSGAPKASIVQKGRWKTDAGAGGVAILSPAVAVSYMPLAHGADRGIAWQVLVCGGRLGFARESHEELLRDLQSIRPRFFLGFSHFWSRLYADFNNELRALLGEHVLTRVLEELKSRGQTLTSEPADIMGWSDFQKAMDTLAKSRKGKEIEAKHLEKFRRLLGQFA